MPITPSLNFGRFKDATEDVTEFVANGFVVCKRQIQLGTHGIQENPATKQSQHHRPGKA